MNASRLRTVVAGVLLLGAVGALVVLAWRDASGGREPLEVVSPTPASPSGSVVVHVVGEVVAPGVYTLSTGSHLFEAVAMAGGPTEGADTQAVNLAAVLVHGRQYRVPPKGEGPVGSPQPDGLVDINTATLEELDGLYGIGPKLARDIIAYREENGPFQRAEDLLLVPGIGPKTLAGFRDRVTVR
ncbi:MAG: helix-hairpin-helix domain-containing protein [Chloroflexi bacterium]|nr:helix-hairpin-helix domain-containing protein [Chloroflexota bacterium]